MIGRPKHAIRQEVEDLPAVKRIFIKSRVIIGLAFMSWLLCFVACEKPIEPTPDMDAAQHFWIRVLLFDNIKEFTLLCREGFDVFAEAEGTSARFGSTAGTIPISVVDGRIFIGIHVFGKDVTIKPNNPYIFSADQDLYRGNLRLIVNTDGNAIDAINSLPLESYLAGVVGSEMPSYWEPEALKSQAVAARTYCLFIKHRFGPGRNWDVRRSQANQVYGGIAAESPMVWDAVKATAGKVLACTQDSEEKIFPTYYSSTCGGHTEDSKNVFGDSYVSLQGVECPHCKDVSRKSFLDWGGVKFNAESAGKRIIDRYPRFGILEKIVDIEPYEVSEYGDLSRICSLMLVGQNGRQKSLRAEDLRLTIDSSGKMIKSNSYTVTKQGKDFVFTEGTGFGHCVGMCQYGAEGMARKGSDFRQILEFYYPRSNIWRLY